MSKLAQGDIVFLMRPFPYFILFKKAIIFFVF